MTGSPQQPDMWGPLAYRIRISGILSDTWAAEYAAMNIAVEIDPSRPNTTTLVGTLEDQAQLIGLIVRLYDRGYPILCVECLPTPGAHD